MHHFTNLKLHSVGNLPTVENDIELIAVIMEKGKVAGMGEICLGILDIAGSFEVNSTRRLVNSCSAEGKIR